LLAQAAGSTSSLQKRAAGQTFAPDWGDLLLTIDEAIAPAVANDSSLRIADPASRFQDIRLAAQLKASRLASMRRGKISKKTRLEVVDQVRRTY